MMFDPNTQHPALPKATEPRRNRAPNLLTQPAIQSILRIMISHDIRKMTKKQIEEIMQKEIDDKTGNVTTTKALSRNLNLLSHPLLKLDAQNKIVPLIEEDRSSNPIRYGPVTAAGLILFRRSKPQASFF